MQTKTCAAKHNLTLQRMLDLAVVCVILLIGYVYTYDVERVLDIGLWDETDYLQRGLRIPIVGFPIAQDAPIYALWYYGLSFFQPDPIDLYFLNYKLMTVLPPLALFIALRTLSVSRLIALFVSAAFLFSYANYPTWPKVSHFAVLALLCGFSVCNYIREKRLQTCALAVTALIVSYIRPEFFLAFIGLVALLVFLSLRLFHASRSFKSIIPLLATLLPCMYVIACLGQPTAGDRSMIAFGQHYAGNWVIWHHDALTNHWSNWVAIVNADFGDVQTPFAALMNNPAAIARHVLQNLQSLPDELRVMIIFRYLSGYAPKVAFTAGVLVLVVVGIALIGRQKLKQTRDHLHDNWTALRFRAMHFLIILMPVIISVLVIAPRRHYLYILGALLVFGLTALLFRNSEQSEGHGSYSTTALLCLALLLTTHPLSALTKMPDQSNLHTINYLRSLNIHIPVKLLEADGGYGRYIGENYTHIREHGKNSPFTDFLAERSINMIVVSKRLSQDSRFRNDPEWHAFTKNPMAFGFTERVIPDTAKRRLYIRREIINTQQGTESR